MSTPARNSSTPTKRFCPATSPASPQTSGLDAAIRELIESTTVPDCVKNAFTRIVEEFSLVRQERDKLLQENLLLRRRLGISPGAPVSSVFDAAPAGNPDQFNPPPSQSPSIGREPDFHSPCQESERRRSIIISGIPELDSPSIASRVCYDFLSVRNVVFHLDIDCLPVSVYRLGRPMPGKTRLLKVVFPASYFQRLATKRAFSPPFLSGEGGLL